VRDRCAPARARTGARVAGARARRRPVRRGTHGGDVDLAHLHHRVPRALDPLGVGVGEELVHARRDDLPGDAEAVLQPAARAFLAAVGELLPVVVDLVLVLAVDQEGDRLAEGELVVATIREFGKIET
jgi:hypothetical protein